MVAKLYERIKGGGSNTPLTLKEIASEEEDTAEEEADCVTTEAAPKEVTTAAEADCETTEAVAAENAPEEDTTGAEADG